MSKVVNVRKKNLNKQNVPDFEEWSKDTNNLYIGRNMSFYVKGAVGSKWSNPYTVKKYGLEECLKMYENYVRNTPSLYDNLLELDNKTLGCWCAPEPCHGDVLIKLLKEVKKPQDS